MCTLVCTLLTVQSLPSYVQTDLTCMLESLLQGAAAAASLTITPSPAANPREQQPPPQQQQQADPGVLEVEEAARTRGLARLAALLDAGSGIADPDKAGVVPKVTFLRMMWRGRRRC